MLIRIWFVCHWQHLGVQCSDLVMKLRHSCVPVADWVWPSSWFCLLSSPSTGLTPSSSRAQRWITELQAAVYRSWPSGRPVLPLLPSCDIMASSSPPPPPPLLEMEPEPSPVLLLARSLSRLRATSRAERKHWKISALCKMHTHTQDAGLEDKQQPYNTLKVYLSAKSLPKGHANAKY